MEAQDAPTRHPDHSVTAHRPKRCSAAPAALAPGERLNSSGRLSRGAPALCGRPAAGAEGQAGKPQPAKALDPDGQVGAEGSGERPAEPRWVSHVVESSGGRHDTGTLALPKLLAGDFEDTIS